MLTLETLTDEQKEFFQECTDGEYDKKLDIKILKTDHKFVEYGDSLYTITFKHEGVKYELAYVFESGPGRYDWIGHNAAAEDVYLIKIEIPTNITLFDNKTVVKQIQEALNSNEPGVTITIKPIPPSTTNDVINMLANKEMNIFEDTNGWELDWSCDFESKGIKYHAWGSGYWGSLCITKKP